MSEYRFASEHRRQNDLPLQIAEAAKAWRLAALDYDKTLEEWHAEADPQKKGELWDQLQQYELIRDGAQAKVAMLADRYVSEAV
jgi:hypothetical protein